MVKKLKNIDTKIKSNPLKLIVDMNKGGYNSYFKNKAFLGEIFEFLNDNLSEEIDVRFKKNVLDLLEDGKIYSVLLQVSYISEGQVKGSSPMKSIIITKNINIYNVIQRFKIAINKFIDEYELSNYSGKCFVCWREWLSKEDYLKDISSVKVDKIVNEVLLDEMPTSSNEKIKKKSKIIDVSKFEEIINVLPFYNSIDKLQSIGKISKIMGDNLMTDCIKNIELENRNAVDINAVREGVDIVDSDVSWVHKNENLYRNLINYIKNFNLNLININNKVKIKDVFLLNENLNEVDQKQQTQQTLQSQQSKSNSLLFVFEKEVEVKNNANSWDKDINYRIERIICKTDYVLEYWDSFKYPYSRWIDSLISCENGIEKFSRLINEYKIYINNGKVDFIDRLYNFPDIYWAYRYKKYDDKIGSLDLETLTLYKDNKKRKILVNNLYMLEVGD